MLTLLRVENPRSVVWATRPKATTQHVRLLPPWRLSVEAIDGNSVRWYADGDAVAQRPYLDIGFPWTEESRWIFKIGILRDSAMVLKIRVNAINAINANSAFYAFYAINALQSRGGVVVVSKAKG